jgi:heme exporter protein C
MSAVTQAPLTPTAPGERTTPASAKRPLLLTILTIVTTILVVISLYMALAYAGQEADQGDVQRIFYIHVSAFAGAFIAFGIGVIGGIAYLVRRNPRWDRLAVSGIEVGFALALVNLFTGMAWARPIWNTWWTWDPRLTSAAIMVLTYAAYFMLRNGIENADTRRRFASVYGILAFSTVIITFVIIRIRPDTIHPAVIGASPQNAEGGFRLAPSMLATLSYSMVVWSVFIPWVLIWWRLRLENLNERVNALRAKALEE